MGPVVSPAARQNGYPVAHASFKGHGNGHASGSSPWGGWKGGSPLSPPWGGPTPPPWVVLAGGKGPILAPPWTPQMAKSGKPIKFEKGWPADWKGDLKGADWLDQGVSGPWWPETSEGKSAQWPTPSAGGKGKTLASAKPRPETKKRLPDAKEEPAAGGAAASNGVPQGSVPATGG